LALIPVSLVPTLYGSAGLLYVLGAVVLGLGFLAVGIGFARDKTIAHARRLMRASLLYLPGLLALLLLDAAVGGALHP
jgi:protoheme IX farnesyltransferase